MSQYRISFKKGDLSFEVESADKDWVEQKENEYLERLTHLKSHVTRAIEVGTTTAPPTFSQNITTQEFYKKYIKQNKITARPDIALFFVYYLEKIIRKETILTSDIINCFGEIGYPNYNKLNMTDILNQAKRKALLNNINNNWTVTITGDDYVLNIMSGEGK